MAKAMLTIKKAKAKDVTIGSLGLMDVFRSNSHTYIVVGIHQHLVIQDRWNGGDVKDDTHVFAMNLSTGIVAHWSKNVSVTPVKSASIHVEE